MFISPSRRVFIQSGAGAVLLIAGLRPAFAAVVTPPQTLGPFYPREFPLDRDNDLAVVAGQRAKGTITHVLGAVTDNAGRPVAGARVEIWQVNAFGRYHDPRDRRDAPLDPGFQGYGETLTGAAGEYRFRTIKPVPYPGRTAHIHFKITAPGGDGSLVTQLYVQGEPGNARDSLLNNIRDAEARSSLIVPFAPASEIEAEALAARFPIRLGFNAARPG
jgi:protocatechuate 3,4-dioxygenase, beta subunit